MESYDWEGYSPEELEEIQNYVYDDTGVDNAIEEVKDIEADIKRLTDLMKQRVEKLQYELDTKLGKLQRRREFHLNNIRTFALQSSSLKETKTQKKVSMISGDIIIKKSAEKLVKADIVPSVIETLLAPYKKEEQTIKLNWAEMKKNLEIRVVDGKKIVFDKLLKQDVSHLVSIEITPEEVKVQ